MNDSLVIEKMNVAVKATTVVAPNEYLMEVYRYVRELVLPKLEALTSIDESVQLDLDQVELNFNIRQNDLSTQELAVKIAQEIVKACEEQLATNYGVEGVMFSKTEQGDQTGQVEDAVNQSEDSKSLNTDKTQLWIDAFRSFLRFGSISAAVASFKDVKTLLVAWDEESVNRKTIVNTLNSDVQLQTQSNSRFFNQFSVQFHTAWVSELVPQEWIVFFSEMITYLSTSGKNYRRWIEIALESQHQPENEWLNSLKAKKSHISRDFYAFLGENNVNTTKAGSKSVKILTDLLEPYSNTALTQWINQLPDEVRQFLHHLNRDRALQHMLTPVLDRYSTIASQKTQDLQSFLRAIALFSKDKKELSQLLMELNAYASYEAPENPQQQLLREQFVEMLEARLFQLETNQSQGLDSDQNKKSQDILTDPMHDNTEKHSEDHTTITPDNLNQESLFHPIGGEEIVSVNDQTSASPESFSSGDSLANKRNIPLHVQNAGMVLLNPFLPALFKNQNWLDDENNWQSEADQVLAIYGLHYLATGTETFEDITEDQLLIGKLLTGMELETELPTWESIRLKVRADRDKNELTEDPAGTKDAFQLTFVKKLDQEIENLLPVIRENWRPMRNCSWQGLRQDFLIREGELETGEKQNVLTLTQNALDMMLPYKNWGTSMIKFSWMEQMLMVDWEK